ncbi:MAG: hypothetical protein ACJATF_004394, partial [Flavobacteriales bacterium]
TDWKDIPVVYALISTADTAHYIRLEKAFLDPETSALVLAQVSDSIYYSDASVKLVNTDDNREYVFTKVDGNLEGYQRESGIFADTPNWLYKLKTNGIDTLSPGTEYQLIVNRTETSEPVTSTIETLSDITISKPIESSVVKFYSKIDGMPSIPINPNFRWIYNKNNTVLFNANLTFFYDETINGVTENKSFVWPLVTNLRIDGSTTSESIKIDTEEFYKIILQNIEEEITAVRKVRYINLEVIGGGQAFRDYLDVNQANTGLTSSQVIPNFTNLSEGYGIFSSIFAISQDHFIDLTSRDSLRNGQYTKLLNFE